MYSSNQTLKISCDKSQLRSTLAYALELYNGPNCQNPVNLCYQFTSDNTVAIGWWFGDKPDEHWHRFPLNKPSIDVLESVIRQFLDDKPYHVAYDKNENDGGYHRGYIVEAIEPSFAPQWKTVLNPRCGIFTVRPYRCFYAK